MDRLLEREPLGRQERSPGRGSAGAGSGRLTATSISSSGFGGRDHQSEPIARRAPDRSSDANGYCHVARSGPEERDRQDVHLGLVAGPQRLGVGDDAERGEPRHVVGVDHLDVGDVRPRVGHAVRRAGRRDRVEGARGRRRSPIAWKWGWSPAASSRVTGSLQRLRVDEADARGSPSAAPSASRYGSTIAPVNVSRTPSGISFTLLARSRPGGRVRETLEELVDLLATALAIPPQRGLDARRQPARGRRPGGRSRASCGVDDRVLPGRDPERVEVRLAGAGTPRRQSCRSSAGEQPLDEVGGALVERARRRAVRIALDPAVRRVRRVAVDARRARAPALLTQLEWPSRFGRNAGRSGTIASRSSRRGVPFSKSAMYQPLPTIQAFSGWAAT